jgi:hypothetical protein
MEMELSPARTVPHKEGATRQVGDLNDLLENGRRKKLILLDDNILSHPRADDLLEDMAREGLMVNFNQNLDIRLLRSLPGAYVFVQEYQPFPGVRHPPWRRSSTIRPMS